MSDQRTPTPWFLGGSYRDDDDVPMFGIGPYELTAIKPDHYEDTICECWGGNHDGAANAAFIVEACNAYAGLKTLYGSVEDVICETTLQEPRNTPESEQTEDWLEGYERGRWELAEMLRAALAKSEVPSDA